MHTNTTDTPIAGQTPALRSGDRLACLFLMSDTPRTDEQINGKPCTRFAVYVGDSLRDALVPSDFARQLERENARFREALKPFASYAVAHGAVHLCGRNGAYLKAEDWITANEALANVKDEPRREPTQ